MTNIPSDPTPSDGHEHLARTRGIERLGRHGIGAVGLRRVALCHRPQVVFAVWVLVLAKLVAPPLVTPPLEGLRQYVPWFPTSVAEQGIALPVVDHYKLDEGIGDERFTSELPAAVDSGAELEWIDGALELEEVERMDDRVAVLPIGEVPIAWPVEFPLDDVAPAAAEPWLVTHLLLAAWLIGSSLWFALAAARIMRFRRLLKLARPAAPALEAEVRDLARRMQLRQVPEVRVVRRRVSPLVWATSGRATLLLPSELLRRLTRDERATLLAHELAHLKRRDHLVRLLELAALGLFWWHPVAWWARRNAERAAEHCCDAQVIELFPNQARAYALALWTTIDFLSDAPEALPLGASGFSQAHHVKRRMEMILTSTRARRAGRPLGLFLPAIGLAVLPLSLRSLWAEPPTPAAESQQEDVEIILDGDDAASALESTGPVVGPVEIEEEQDQPTEEAIGPVEVEESNADPVKLAVTFLLGSQETEEQGGKPSAKPSSIEERLDRLEKMIQALAERRPGPEATPDAKPRPSKTVKLQSEEKKPRPDKAAIDDAKSRWDELSSKLNKEANSDLKLDASGRLADIVKRATMHLELSKTNLAALRGRQAAGRRCKQGLRSQHS